MSKPRDNNDEYKAGLKNLEKSGLVDGYECKCN